MEKEKDIINNISSSDEIMENMLNVNSDKINNLSVESLELINSQGIDVLKKTKKKKSCRNSKKDSKKLILEKMCIICGKVNTPGIVIMDKKICSCCEEKAVKADIKSEFYEDYKNKISKNVVGKLKNLG